MRGWRKLACRGASPAGIRTNTTQGILPSRTVQSEQAPFRADHAARNLFSSGNLDLFGGSVRLRIPLVEDEPFVLMDIALQAQKSAKVGRFGGKASCGRNRTK
jgi:hypothetical protein